MTKPETRQEMAEWIAEEVLDYKYCGECDVVVRPNIPNEPEPPPTLIDFIYSPDGFFAVWDSFRIKYPHAPISFCINHDDGSDDYGKDWCDLWVEETHILRCSAHGKDRYDAFYSAVYDAMNKEVDREEK